MHFKPHRVVAVDLPNVGIPQVSEGAVGIERVGVEIGLGCRGRGPVPGQTNDTPSKARTLLGFSYEATGNG